MLISAVTDLTVWTASECECVVGLSWNTCRQQNVGVRCSVTLPNAHPSEAVLANQALCCHVDASSVDHLITHGNVDHATTGWSTPVRTPAFLQLIYGTGPSSADTERRYGLVWLCNDDDDDDELNDSR